MFKAILGFGVDFKGGSLEVPPFKLTVGRAIVLAFTWFLLTHPWGETVSVFTDGGTKALIDHWWGVRL